MSDITNDNIENENKSVMIWSRYPADINELIYVVRDLAENIYTALKPGLPQCIYQLKLYNELLKKGFQLQAGTCAVSDNEDGISDREAIIVNGILVIEFYVRGKRESFHSDVGRSKHETERHTRGMLVDFSDGIQSDRVMIVDRVPVYH